jgi:hypothetical protein
MYISVAIHECLNNSAHINAHTRWSGQLTGRELLTMSIS